MAQGSNFSLKAIISLVDKISGPLKGIKMGFAGLGSGFGKLNSGLLGVGASMAGVIAVGGAAAAGVMKFSSSVAKVGDDLAKQSLRIGVTVEQLQKFRHAADLAGVSQELIDKSLLKLNSTLASGSKDVTKLLGALGISMRDSNGHLRSGADLMPELAAAMERNVNPTHRAYIATKLFGEEGQGLITMLAQGRGALEKYMKEAEKFGLITAEEAAAAEAFTDAQARMGKAIDGVVNKIGAGLLPVLQPLIEAFTEWMAINRQMISGKMGEFFGSVADMVRRIDFSAVVDGAIGFTRGLTSVADAVGGFGPLLGIMAGVLSGPLLVSLGAVGTALWSLGSVLLSTPIGWFVLAIGAGAVAIYKNWERVGPWFTGLWRGIQAVVGDVVGAISSLLDGDFAGAITKAFSAFSGLKNIIVSALQDGFAALLSIDWAGGGFAIGQAIGDGLVAVSDWLANLLSGDGDVGWKVLQGIGNLGIAILEGIGGVILGVGKALADKIGTALVAPLQAQLASVLPSWAVEGLGLDKLGQATAAVVPPAMMETISAAANVLPFPAPTAGATPPAGETAGARPQGGGAAAPSSGTSGKVIPMAAAAGAGRPSIVQAKAQADQTSMRRVIEEVVVKKEVDGEVRIIFANTPPGTQIASTSVGGVDLPVDRGTRSMAGR